MIKTVATINSIKNDLKLWGRFISKIKFTDNCWAWGGMVGADGYGRFRINLKTKVSAHRASFVFHKGKIEEGKLILHSCDNPSCVNPDHLSQGTQKDNCVDKVVKNRQARGDTNGSSKLSAEDVLEIRKLLELKVFHRIIAKQYSVNISTIDRISSGECWGHI